jgi:hypothetical protein
MTYPNLTAELTPVVTGLVTDLPATAVANQALQVTADVLYEVDANGVPTTVPLGQSGPFILLVDSEQILCSSFSEGICEVYEYEGTNGRGWNTTTIAAHDRCVIRLNAVALIGEVHRRDLCMPGVDLKRIDGT